MIKWIYRLSDSEYLYGGPTEPTYSTGTQGVAVVPRHPDPRLERYSAASTAGFMRAATTQEVADYDAEQQTVQSLSRFDDEKLVKALAIWTAGKLSVALPTAKAEIIQIYKTL